MGRKVNPIGMRIGFNKTWTSHWYSDQTYASALQEDAAIRNYVNKRYHHSGICSTEIFRNRGDIVVTVHTSKPGLIIGRSGVGAQELKANLEKAVLKVRKFVGKVNLRVNIMEVRNPELNANVVAETIANQIERRISPKRAIRQAMERTMEKRAKGIKIKISGRLNGADIARSEMVSNGSIPLQTLRSDISYALAEANTTYGAIGVKVWIYTGQADSLPIQATPEQQRTHTRR